MAIELKISKQAQIAMSQRRILEEDIRPVIEGAETSGVKLYQPGTDLYLAKKTTDYATFYAKYSYTPPGYTIHTVYMHRSKIIED